MNIHEFVTALYQLFLKRNPDDRGLGSYVKQIADNNSILNNIIYNISVCREREILMRSEPDFKPIRPACELNDLLDFMQSYNCSRENIALIAAEFCYSDDNLAKACEYFNNVKTSVDNIVQRINLLHEINEHYVNFDKNNPYGRIVQLVDKIKKRQASKKVYQPLYKIDILKPDEIERDCMERCFKIRDAMAGLNLSQMKLLDVGCNSGFFSFYFSEFFNSVCGVEIDRNYVELCNEINYIHKKNIKFKCDSFFENFNNYVHIYDIVLLMSVVHYLFHANPYTTALKKLNSIVNGFDYTIIEMSTSLDYNFMPADPEDILNKLDNIEYRELFTTERNNRKVYLITRKSVNLDIYPIDAATNKSFIIDGPIIYSSYKKEGKFIPYSRVYFFREFVMKKYIDSSNFMNIVSNCARFMDNMRDFQYIPSFFYAQIFHDYGCIAMQRIEGRILKDSYQYVNEPVQKIILICKIIRFLVHMAKKGLYWNDLSAHNIIISGTEVYFIDFDHSGPKENLDHIASFTYLLEDIQLSSPASYKSPAYNNIVKYGTDPAHHHEICFQAPDGFFAPEIRKLYDLIMALPNIKDLANIEPHILKSIESVAAQPLRIKF